MFDRLLESLGTISTKDDAVQVQQSETQLATAILLFAVIQADSFHAASESRAFYEGLRHIFGLSEAKCWKLMSRAVSQYRKEPSLLAPATLLKHLVSPGFRQLVFVTAQHIAMADGHLHDYEADVLSRIETLLDLRDARNTQSLSA